MNPAGWILFAPVESAEVFRTASGPSVSCRMEEQLDPQHDVAPDRTFIVNQCDTASRAPIVYATSLQDLIEP